MITSWQIYWLTRMDYFQGAALSCSIFVGISAVIFGILWGVSADQATWRNDSEKYKNIAARNRVRFIRLFVLLIIFVGMSTFIPSSKELAAIIIIPKITNSVSENKALRELPTNVIDLANEWLIELKPKNNEVKK